MTKEEATQIVRGYMHIGLAVNFVSAMEALGLLKFETEEDIFIREVKKKLIGASITVIPLGGNTSTIASLGEDGVEDVLHALRSSGFKLVRNK